MWIISRLNFNLIYRLSDILYYVLHYVIAYRKQIVRKNLELAFPKMKTDERRKLEKKFYKNLTDVFLESFKSMNMTEDELKNRYKFKNIDFLNSYFKKKQNVILIAGHYSSWEWVFILERFTNFKVNAIYKKLSNKYFEKWAKKIRSKYNGNLISTKETFKEILKHSKSNDLHLYGFGSDQSPRKNKKNYWGTFLNNYVPIHTGAETIAKKYNMAVIFMDVQRVGRGYYETTFSLITDEPKKLANFKITDKFISLLEKQINKKPEFYTWTHNRFKHRKTN